jgi:hypothetical protein
MTSHFVRLAHGDRTDCPRRESEHSDYNDSPAQPQKICYDAGEDGAHCVAKITLETIDADC